MKDILLKSVIGLSALQASSMALALTVSFAEIPDIEPSLAGQKPLAISNDGKVSMVNTDFELLNWDAATGIELIYAGPEYTGTNAIWPIISEDGNTILFSSFLQGSTTNSSSGNPAQDYYYHNGEVTIYNYSTSGVLVPNLYAMSGDGSVMGGYHSSWAGKLPASFTTANQITKHVSAPEDTTIAAINMDGTKFVSQLHFNGISAVPSTAYVWEAGGTPVASDVEMAVKGFSANGDVVLGAIKDPRDFFSAGHSVLWDVNSNQYTYLYDMPFAQAFSDNASVVVGNTSWSAFAGNMMLIWDSVNGVRNLSDVLAAHGVTLAGWNNLFVENISRDGTKMVGSGTNPDGQIRAFVINITQECSPFL